MRFALYLHQTDSGTFSGFVPDAPGCYFAGESLTDTIEDAEQALEAWLEAQAESGAAPPVAQGIEAHVDDEDCTGGCWAFAEVDTDFHFWGNAG